MQDDSTLIPVYVDQNGIPVIMLFREDRETGTFRRMPGEPLRLFRDNIEGISEPIADLVSRRYTRWEGEWESPTVCTGRNRPRSFYRFMRDGFARREIHVAVAPSLNGRITRLKIHRLNFRSSMSMSAKQLFARRFMEALSLCADEELTCLKQTA